MEGDIKNCQDKAGYVSVQEARAAATADSWRYERPKGQRLVAYLCDKCRLYHLTTEFDDV